MLGILALACGNAAPADDASSGFVQSTHGDRRYVVFVPSAPPPAEGYPLILFLHSAGERGTDGLRQLELGLGPAIRRRTQSFPGIVVFPQADYADGPILETWRSGEPGGELALAILADVEQRWPIDPTRRAVTGWSMGAYGALSLAAADPERFSRVLAVAGGGEPEWGPALARLPVWLIHGADDRIVPPSESRSLISHVPEPHARLYYSEVPSARHDVARSVYENQAALDWLLSSGEAPPPVDAITAPEPQGPSAAEQTGEAFAPELLISRAISLRLGNQALQTLSAGVPASLEEEGLHGELPDVEDNVEFDGQRYQVRFRDMSYEGNLARSVLEGRGAGRLRVALALSDFEVRIGSIEVSGRSDGAVARQVRIVIGHREPVWLEIEVEPVPTSEGLLRLKLRDSKFSIADHNWYVVAPQDVQVRGDGLTGEMMTTAVVGGLYQRRNLIEEKILEAVEPILRQVEQRVDFAPLGQLVTSLWPLPVYQPRLQVRLEDVATDADGISLVFGCEVDDPGQTRRGPMQQVTAQTPPAKEIEPVADLRAAVALDVVEHLSGLLAGTDMMALYTADVPGRPFRELDDVAGLSQSLQELEGSGSLADVRSRMALTDPFRYLPLEQSPEGGVAMAIDVPRLSLTVFAREEASAADWQKIARRELVLRQPVTLQAVPQLDGPTELVLTWGEDPTLSAAQQPEAGAAPDELVSRCRQGWIRWVGLQRISAPVPDVAVGNCALRLAGFSWQGSCLTAEFEPAATVLVNGENQPVEYCIRSEESRWSRPLTLPPGKQHIYRNGAALQVRSAARWSREGESLSPGIYDFSAEGDRANRRWIARQPRASTALRRISLSQ